MKTVEDFTNEIKNVPELVKFSKKWILIFFRSSAPSSGRFTRLKLISIDLPWSLLTLFFSGIYDIAFTEIPLPGGFVDAGHESAIKIRKFQNSDTIHV